MYDYQFRLGNYPQALMLSGLTTRMAHGLQLNLEYSVEPGEDAPSTTYLEARRRVMWACYILDTWTGSGVDQLTLLHENDIKIQLPCNERNFLLQLPSVTERLGARHKPQRDEDVGLATCYVRLISLWKRVAR